MINFVYCFDKNYNKQALTSMISLLENVDEKVNINIIHKNQKNSEFIPKSITQHLNLNLLNIYKFNNNSYYFPNISNTHVSEATYYRIFIDEYINNTLKEIVYLDSDIICNTNPLPSIYNSFRTLRNSEYVLSACTEQNVADSKFRRLSMKSSKYFNAGFLLIDFAKWKSQKIKEDLLVNLTNPQIDFEFWDQDLFNYYFDGKYNELDNELNWNIYIDKKISKNYERALKNKVKFFHFAGNKKPWKGEGLFSRNAEIYQKNYRKLFGETYHIEHKWKPNSLLIFLKSFLNLKFFNLKYKFSFIKLFFKSFFIVN